MKIKKILISILSIGVASPWYNQPGGGLQFQLPNSTANLISEGYLRLKNN
jgi:hypothetical protein